MFLADPISVPALPAMPATLTAIRAPWNAGFMVTRGPPTSAAASRTFEPNVAALVRIRPAWPVPFWRRIALFLAFLRKLWSVIVF